MNALKFSGLIVLQGISQLSQPLPMDQGQAKVPVRRHGLTVLNLAHDIWMVNTCRPCWIQEGKLNQPVICPKHATRIGRIASSMFVGYLRRLQMMEDLKTLSFGTWEVFAFLTLKQALNGERCMPCMPPLATEPLKVQNW